MSNKGSNWAKIRAKAKAEAKAQAKEEAKTKKKKITIIVTAVVAVIVVAVSAWLIFKPEGPGATKGITVSIISKNNTMWATTFPTTKDCLGDALVEKGLLKPEDYVDGVIHTIRGVKADYEADKAVWKLYVNAEEVTTDIYKTPLKDGCDYRLEYTIVK